MGKDKHKDSFFDREEIEQESDAQLINRINDAVKAAEDWEAENPEPQR